MAYTKKPSQAPTFNAKAFTDALVAGKPVSSTLAAQYIAWKQWVESTNTFDGADKGGLRDVLDADMKAVDLLKAHTDSNSQAILELRADVEALKEAPPSTSFP